MRIFIERVVLEGVDLPSDDGSRLKSDIQEQLGRVLDAAQGLNPEPASRIELTLKETPDAKQVGEAVTKAVAGVLGGKT